MKELVACLFLLGSGTVSCAAEDSDADSIPAVQQEALLYLGTSPSDIWGGSGAARVFMHWDGADWTDMIPLAQIPFVSSFCPIEAGKVWIAGNEVFGILDVQGNFTDLSAQVPIEPPVLFRNVSCGHGTAMVSTGTHTTSAVFLWNGSAFEPIEKPDGTAALGSAMIYGPDNIYALGTQLSDPEPDFVRDTAGPDYHFDGQSWTRGTSNHTTSSISAASSSFPPNDIWMSCGRNPAHFDGKVMGPLPAPMPAIGECTFGYVDGRVIILYSGGVGSPEDTPEAYSCDTAGNCSLLDVTGTTDREYRRIEWDGERWTGDQHVVTIKSCTGAGCGYGAGGPGSLVAGELEDGTMLLSAVANDGVKRLYFVR